MKRSIYACLTVLSTAALLTACGGGSSSNDDAGEVVTSDAVDKYVGTWSNCYREGAQYSISSSVTFKKVSATTVSYASEDYEYQSPDCTGTLLYTDKDSGTVALQGTKVINGETVDLVVDNSTVDGVGKQISVIHGNQLLLGDLTRALDENGYPTVLNTQYQLVRQ